MLSFRRKKDKKRQSKATEREKSTIFFVYLFTTFLTPLHSLPTEEKKKAFPFCLKIFHSPKQITLFGVAERGCYFLLLSAIFCYSGHLDFLVRLKEVLFCAILGSSATPLFVQFYRPLLPPFQDFSGFFSPTFFTTEHFFLRIRPYLIVIKHTHISPGNAVL